MKRDMDLIRAVLIHIEKHYPGNGSYQIEVSDFDQYNPEIVIGHLRLITEAGLVLESCQTSDGSLTRGLSWDGHDFLDSVRDPKIWQKTKEAGEKVGGWTVELLADYAKGLIKLQFDNLLNGAMP